MPVIARWSNWTASDGNAWLALTILTNSQVRLGRNRLTSLGTRPMLGPLFLLAYRIVGWIAGLMVRERGDALRAAWALRFSSMTDGGIDDDFAEEVYTLVRGRPEFLTQ